MSFKVIAAATLLIASAMPAFAEGGVVVTPERIQAGDVVITQDRIEVPGVSINQGGIAVVPGQANVMVAPSDASAPVNAQGNNYTNADLNNMDFRGRNLQNAVFVNATLTNVNFENADLRGANFTNADLKDANMNGANLEGANLTNATLTGTQMLDVNLHNAILTNVDMNEAITGKRPPVPQGTVKQAAEIKDALTARKGMQQIDLTVNFDFNSDTLTMQGRQQLEQAALALQGMGTARILVQGHTDNVGSDAYNLALSERRAQAVVRELKAMGNRLPGVDLIAKGYGESQPVDTNDSDLGRAKNRRVTLVNVSHTLPGKH